MEELTTMLRSAAWWLSVVIVAILMNLFPAYLKRGLFEPLSALSSRWKRPSEKEARDLDDEVVRLASNDHEEIVGRLEELKLRAKAILWMLASVMILTHGTYAAAIQRFGSDLFFPLSAIAFYLSIREWVKAYRLGRTLSAARLRKAPRTT